MRNDEIEKVKNEKMKVKSLFYQKTNIFLVDKWVLLVYLGNNS